MIVYTREWYNNGCQDNKNTEEYNEYYNNNLPQWYKDFSIHDSKILKHELINDVLVLYLEADDIFNTLYSMRFINFEITEMCNLDNKWCIADEIYIKNSTYEYHLMVQGAYSYNELEYFTIKCSDVELHLKNKIFCFSNNIPSSNGSLID